MNPKQAETEGLSFTGIYERDKEKTKERIAKIRLQYPKVRIVLVTEPDSKLSRGGRGVGYSAYADKKYFAYRRIEEFNERIQNHESKVAKIKTEYEEKLVQAEKDLQQNKSHLETNLKIVNE